MECKSCGAQWVLRAGMPQPKACPFCGAALPVETPKPVPPVSSGAVVPGETADDDDWFVETTPPQGLAMDDAAWERCLRDTPPAPPKPAAPQPEGRKAAAPQAEEDDWDEAAFLDFPEYRRVEGDPFREEIEEATKDWERKGWGKVITAGSLEAGTLVKAVRLNYTRCKVVSQPEERTFEGRPQIRFLMEHPEFGRPVPVMQDPRYQYALWPSQAVIRMDQIQNGMELICGVRPEREDTLYRIDALEKAADGGVEAVIVKVADGSREKRSFRPNDRFLELKQEERKLEYIDYDDEKGKHIFMDPETYDLIELYPTEVGKALPYIEAAEAVHDVIRCTLDGKQTDLWAEVSLKVLSTMSVPAGGTDQLAATKNGLQFWVPASITAGDCIRVDTRTGAFLKKTEPEELPHGRDVANDEFRAAPNGDGEEGYHIVEYIGSGKRQVVVPALIDGKPITMFEMDIFGETEVERVTVSEGVKTISTSTVYLLANETDEVCRKLVAKKTCRNLTWVSLPGSVTTIDVGAFAGCPQLSEIALPDGLTELGEGAFKGCAKLTSIRIPKGVREIRRGTFAGCTGLGSVELAEGVTTIGDMAFDGCTTLRGIVLPRSVTEVGDFAFCGCSSLEIVIVQNPQLELDGYETFKGCPNVRIQRI